MLVLLVLDQQKMRLSPPWSSVTTIHEINSGGGKSEIDPMKAF